MRPTKPFANPIVALGFGLFFLCGVACTHIDEILTSPLSTVPDWAAGGFLVVAAVLSHRRWSSGQGLQVAAWGVMAGLLLGSAVGNFEEWLANAPDAGVSGLVSMSQGTYLAAVTTLFLVALAALIATLRSPPAA